jgi:hypothetical protein
LKTRFTALIKRSLVAALLLVLAPAARPLIDSPARQAIQAETDRQASGIASTGTQEEMILAAIRFGLNGLASGAVDQRPGHRGEYQ